MNEPSNMQYLSQVSFRLFVLKVHFLFYKDRTSGVASENLQTVSIPPNFQWPSSLTNTDDMQTLLWLDLPW